MSEEFGGETIGLASGGSLFESIHCRFAAASLIGKPCSMWFWPVSLGLEEAARGQVSIREQIIKGAGAALRGK
jgi:hypothetical protein